MSEYTQALRTLNEARAAAVAARERTDALLTALHESAEWKAAAAAEAEANAALETADKALRERALYTYTQTGNKSLPGAKVRVSTVYVYDESKAIAWARSNAPALIVETVNKKGFEALVAATPDTRPEFVTVALKPTVAVDSDLTAALALEE